MEIFLLIVFCFVIWAGLKFLAWYGELTAPLKQPNNLSEQPESEQQQSEPVARKLTTTELAKELFEQFPANGPSGNRLWNDCEAHELDIQAVDEEIDRLREAANRKVVNLSVTPEYILDISKLDSLRARIVGVSHWVTFTERKEYGSSTYVLVREPRNPHDKNAIAVYGHGRKVGYVSRGKAASLAPLLDELGSQGFSVSGSAQDLRMNLPRVPVLREFVKNFDSKQSLSAPKEPLVVSVRFEDFWDTDPDLSSTEHGTYAYLWCVPTSPTIGLWVYAFTDDGKTPVVVVDIGENNYSRKHGTRSLKSLSELVTAESWRAIQQTQESDIRTWLTHCFWVAGIEPDPPSDPMPGGYEIPIPPFPLEPNVRIANRNGLLWWRAMGEARAHDYPADHVKKLHDLALDWFGIRDRLKNK